MQAARLTRVVVDVKTVCHRDSPLVRLWPHAARWGFLHSFAAAAHRGQALANKEREAEAN